MRYESTSPAYGEKRTVTRFCWLPVKIRTYNGIGSTTSSSKWLETASWEEEWTKGRSINFWKKIRWIYK